MRVLMVSNTSWSLVNFRLGLAKYLRDALGHEVLLSAPPDGYESQLLAEGFDWHPLKMDGQNFGLLEEMRSFLAILSLTRDLRPDVLLLFTPKPNIYGGLVAQLGGTPAIHNVAGLGRIFMDPTSLKARAALKLYRVALMRSEYIFFQNEQDRDLLTRLGGIRKSRSERIFGSGIEPDYFHPKFRIPKRSGGCFTFLLFARLLRSKGIEIYAQAAKALSAKLPNARFELLGPIIASDPDGLSRANIAELERLCSIRYLGSSDDVRSHLAGADCVVLPSFYGEGVPRSLLEAAAMGIPIITTDSVGCRDVVVDGVSGWLVPPRQVEPLANAMAHVAQLDSESLATIGRKARSHATTKFDEREVFEAYRKRLAVLVSA